MPAKRKTKQKTKPKTKSKHATEKGGLGSVVAKVKSKHKTKTSAKAGTKTVSKEELDFVAAKTKQNFIDQINDPEPPGPFDPIRLHSMWTERLFDDQSWAVKDRNTGEEPIRPSNWMSLAGVQCVRRLYFERVAQSQREPFPAIALARMREGNRHEQLAIQDLMALGYTWAQGQGRTYIADLLLSGKRDGYLVSGDDKILCEIKSMENQVFNQYHAVDDFLNSKWYSGYPYQLNAYMVADDQTTSMFIIRNRSTGQLRFIPMAFDTELWRDTYRRFSACNDAVEQMEAPPMIGETELGHPKHCPDCPFKRYCCPAILSDSPGVALMAEGVEVAEQKLDRWCELKSTAPELKTLDEWRKSTFKGMPSAVVGKYLVTGKEARNGSWRGNVDLLEPKNDNNL